MIKNLLITVNEDLASEDPMDKICAHLLVFMIGAALIVAGIFICKFYLLILPLSTSLLY